LHATPEITQINPTHSLTLTGIRYTTTAKVDVKIMFALVDIMYARTLLRTGLQPLYEQRLKHALQKKKFA
jgi:hypothetical protein